MNKLYFSIFVTLMMGVTGCKKETVPTPAAQPTINMTQAKSAPGARVFIMEPKEGQTVSNPVTVKFGIEGIDLAPAGEVKDNSGHHHLLIDAETLPSMSQPLPFSDKVLHFGQGQTEAAVNLTPGSHTLQIILAGGNHIPHDPPVVSEQIRVKVQ